MIYMLFSETRPLGPDDSDLFSITIIERSTLRQIRLPDIVLLHSCRANLMAPFVQPDTTLPPHHKSAVSGTQLNGVCFDAVLEAGQTVNAVLVNPTLHFLRVEFALVLETFEASFGARSWRGRSL